MDNEFLAAALRHAAGFLCPCSAASLRSSIVESLKHLADSKDLILMVESAIEGLIIGGDLLELNQVTTDDPDVKGTWLFAAPPSYVVRPNGSIFLTGVVADSDTYLPQALMERIRYDGFTRAIMPMPDEQLADELSELGLQSLSSDNWLKPPKAETYAECVERHNEKLRVLPRSGEIPQLQIIDPFKPVSYYRGRWIKPKSQTGVFVGRRPQEFGSPIWCVVRLENGQAQQLLDLPLKKSRLRGCDAAWHLQMAIDRSNGTPQTYSVRITDRYAFIDFYSPLPLWGERRLMLLGRHADAAGCLLSYRLPIGELATEEKFFQERLWLSPAPAASIGER
ncbi:MAG: hypothetical protein L0Z50_19050 [Verrucomicrobiales bacterium]|nr:hypothetical protein [Verrucomicrobiales bacterium]